MLICEVVYKEGKKKSKRQLTIKKLPHTLSQYNMITEQLVTDIQRKGILNFTEKPVYQTQKKERSLVCKNEIRGKKFFQY